jgi:hypothetical protein
MDCAKIQQVVSDNVCSQLVSAKNLNAENAVLNNLCVPGLIQGSQVSADMLGANSLCAVAGTINKLCVDDLTVGSFLPYIKYRATVDYSVDQTYTLGAFLNFDSILDDPNNNVSLVPNTSYTAAVAGYYMMSLKVNSSNLQSGTPILGNPIANPQIYVNGILVREIYAPFLSFFNAQKVILDSLITLQKNDVVTMKYNVLADNGTPVLGTVDIVGSGVEDGNSFFKIILLSAIAPASTIACTKCPVISVLCSAVTTPCQPLVPVVPGAPKPCDSCMIS